MRIGPARPPPVRVVPAVLVEVVLVVPDCGRLLAPDWSFGDPVPPPPVVVVPPPEPEPGVPDPLPEVEPEPLEPEPASLGLLLGAPVPLVGVVDWPPAVDGCEEPPDGRSPPPVPGLVGLGACGAGALGAE